MNDMTHPRAKFRAMTEGTQEDWAIIAAEQMQFAPQNGKRIIEHLKLLSGDYGGFPVDRLTHCLQTATRAHRDGRDEEYVVMALLHDIGDTLGAFNHPDVAAAILKPFLSEENLWIVQHHGIFQGHYFFHYIGLDRDMRDQFKDHQHYDACVLFCEKYDQPSFDPDYESLPLEFFAPMVERVCGYPKTSIYKKVMAGAE
ncbi:MAG: HD domain-containing protein [Sphingopyxis sp.]|nr:HD domain-containing protein [Sphingopyxis sp.]